MTPKTLTALQGSIAKWEAILAGTAQDEGTNNCPLCLVFWRNDCRGCPVRERTGQTLCEGSPYDAWASHWNEHPAIAWTASDPETRRLAVAELEFLTSLLPKTNVETSKALDSDEVQAILVGARIAAPYVAKADGTFHFATLDPEGQITYDYAKTVVGGYVERVAPKATPSVIFLCNEEGHVHRLPLNAHGGNLYRHGPVAGDIIVIPRKHRATRGWL
jgi:hypothetical protein